MTEETAADEPIHEPRLWCDNGWTARVIKNNDDDGWAVEMIRAGEPEPALTGPWTMGRDKKNPKPLDHGGFRTLVKNVTEVLLRHEQTAGARLHRTFSYVSDDGQRIRIDLDIAPDDDDPHAVLVATDERTNEVIRTSRVLPSFKLSAASAQRFVRTGEA